MVGLNISRKVMLMPLAMAAIFFRTGISYSVYRRGWETVGDWPAQDGKGRSRCALGTRKGFLLSFGTGLRAVRNPALWPRGTVSVRCGFRVARSAAGRQARIRDSSHFGGAMVLGG